ncbi:septation protein SpoVG family protein [Endomicrobium proavitum]|nr:septation protein SpoVG family protein [Endomicrobium proavitum]
MLCMPSRKRDDGTFKDICHPINGEFRAELEKLVLDEYKNQVKEELK